MSQPRRAVDVPFTVAAMLVALVPRIYVAVAWPREPVWDGHYYHYGAQRIAAGLGYSEDVLVGGVAQWKPWCHYPVGYSGFLAGLYRLFGADPLVATVASAVLGALVVVVAHRLALRWLPLWRARLAALLVVIHPGLIAWSALVMTEVLSALLVLGAMWLGAKGLRRTWWTVAAGAVIGLGTLVRPTTLALAPLLLLARWPWDLRAARDAGLASVVALGVVLPWTIRNCQVMDGCALVSTNGGWNLAIGALTETGRFRGLSGEDGCAAVTGQVQQDRCWAEVGAKLIANDPVRWVRKAPAKLDQLWGHESFAIEYLHETAPGDWPDERRYAAHKLLGHFHQVLLALAALAVVGRPALRRDRWVEWLAQLIAASFVAVLALGAALRDDHPYFLLPVAAPLLALLPLPGRPKLNGVGRLILASLALTSVTHVVFFGEDRYHMVMSPVLCVLAAAALRRSDDDAAAPAAEPPVGRSAL